MPAARGDWSLDRELDGDLPEWGRHAALEAGGWTQVTKPLTNPVRFSLDEAVFMLGACASFVSYLCRKHVAGGPS